MNIIVKMKILLGISLIFVFAAKCMSETVSITPPNIVKKNPGENCKLQWMVSGTFSNYTIVSLKTGNPKNLGPNTDTDYDSVKGIITLYIWNVQNQDAGYYVLTLSTGSQQSPSSNGVLFVYGYFSVNMNSVSGKTQFTQGEVIEVNCSATFYFAPPGLQNKIYYFWYDNYNGYLQNTSSGPAITANGDVVAGYSFKNNGQILSVDTSQITYSNSYYYCQVQEEGSFYKSGQYSWRYTLSSQPLFYNVWPLSKKWNYPSSYGSTSFQFYYSSNPPLTSYSNWSFVDTSGNQQYIPLPTNLSAASYTYISIPLSGQYGSYGNFTMTLGNTLGSNSIAFQLMPPGVPDPPSDFKVQYITHSVVSLQWRCGWMNGEPQAVTATLTNIANNKIVETLKTSLVSNTFCYNSVFTSTLQSFVMPDTDYMASIWSTNLYGRSRVATLPVKTPVKPTFSVSCEDISFTETTAIVSVATSVVGVWLNVTCCVDTRAQCILQTMTLLTSQNQIVIDPIPTGNDYVFDFVLFNRGFNYIYTLAQIKGLKKPRNADGNTIIPCNTGVCNATRPQPSDCNATENENRSLLIAVIVLASLLGVTALLLIICLVVNLRLRRGKSTNQNYYEQERRLPSPPRNRAVERDSEPNPYSNYEGMTGGNDEYRMYAQLDENPPPKPPQIRAERF